ncbi:MAG: sugar ABC transporter permease [Rectinemataceae bacterium]
MTPLTADFMLSSLGEVGSTILAVASAIALLELVLWVVFGKILKHRLALPIMLITPAAVGICILVIYPMLYELKLAFSNMSLYRFKNPQFGPQYGWANIVRIFTEPVLKQTGFFKVLGRTVVWTLVQISFHVLGGLALALLLNKKIHLKGLYRTILVLPWAVPQIVAVLAWRGEFNFEYGYINVLLGKIGVGPVNWKMDPFWNFVAVNITNIWLGIPFMMVTLLGGLQSIDSTYYEAADIDGANAWYKFRNVTLPLLKPVLTPAVVLGLIWTFNNFNVPFFINENELESSDILVTALFRAAFEYNTYGFAAMFAFVILFILLGMTLVYMKVSDFRPVAKKVMIAAEEA